MNKQRKNRTNQSDEDGLMDKEEKSNGKKTDYVRYGLLVLKQVVS
jgi:hypothetical protein